LDKVDAIYRFLVFGDEGGTFEYVYYDSLLPDYFGPLSNPFIASHFLEWRKGVCNDFAELFAALARAVGLKVTVVSGTNPGTGSGHMWNKVSIDGVWYRLDATWANSSPYVMEFYAEFYPEFPDDLFGLQHEETFTESFVERY
jgi:transglutaminase-like putative cysteine protease